MSAKKKLMENTVGTSEDVRVQLRNSNKKIIEAKRSVIKKERAIRSSIVPTEVKGAEKLHPIVENNRKFLEKLGVDVNTWSRRVTPELEKCFRGKVGEKRFKEIEKSSSGDPQALRVSDLIKARKCVNQ